MVIRHVWYGRWSILKALGSAKWVSLVKKIMLLKLV